MSGEPSRDRVSAQTLPKWQDRRIIPVQSGSIDDCIQVHRLTDPATAVWRIKEQMRKHRLNIVIVLISGLVIAGSAMSLIRCYYDPTFNSDALHHLMPIHNLIDGKGYTYRDRVDLIIPPGYGIASYVAFLFVRDIEYSGVVISALSYILLIPLAYITGRFLFGRKVGLLAAWFTTFFPALLALSSSVGSDALSCLCMLLSFYSYLKLLEGTKGPGLAICLGLLLGFGYLIRPENFLIGILAIASLFVFCIREKQVFYGGNRLRPYEALSNPFW